MEEDRIPSGPISDAQEAEEGLAYNLYYWLQTLVAFILAELAMVAGYFLFEAVMYGVPAAIGAVGPNMIQGLGGVVVGMLCRLAVPRLEKVIK